MNFQIIGLLATRFARAVTFALLITLGFQSLAFAADGEPDDPDAVSINALRAALSPLPPMRAERLHLDCGADLVTIFGTTPTAGEVPLVAFLNDTLGDDRVDNDTLRYFWVFSYCPPSKWQHVLASIPFNYSRVRSGSSKVDPSKEPPVIFDFSKGDQSAVRRILWSIAQNAIFDTQGWFLHAGSRTYTRNEREYRRGHLERGLGILNAYRYVKDDVPELNDDRFESRYGDVKTTGVSKVLLGDSQLRNVYFRDTMSSRRQSAKNWELLRQRCEEEGLYFDPIPGAPARARHALVWVAAENVSGAEGQRKYNGRFLNIASPWADERIKTWEGYTRVFYEMPDGRISREPNFDARPVTMIPLAVYGLDFPRIPVLLVDFRSVLNAKKRELSRKVLDDVGRYLLDVSPFGQWKYYAARAIFNVFTKQKGIDLGQPSRLSASAQLATLLELRDLLDPDLRRMVEKKLNQLNVNPLGSDYDAERQIAYLQYKGLLESVQSGDLARRLEKDRGGEITRMKHGRFKTILLKTATVATAGVYRHHDDDIDSREAYAIDRELDRHAQILASVVEQPGEIDVVWAPEKYRDSLDFVIAHGAHGDERLVASCDQIFLRTGDQSTKMAALLALDAIADPEAARSLERLANDAGVAPEYRARCLELMAKRAERPPGHDAIPAVAGAGGGR